MRRLAITAAVACLAVLAPGAAAAKRSVPAQFAGVMLDKGGESDPPGAMDQQMALMARSGAESLRVVFSWEKIQPKEDGPFDFGLTDLQVGTAARHGLGVLPVMLYAPPWAQAFPARGPSSPPLTTPFRAYLRAAIRRYGSKGTFWRDNPSVPRRPIRYWQIWNEAHFIGFWNPPKKSRYAWPRGYARLLKAADATIHRSDRRGRTVVGGLFGDAWLRLRELYRGGGKRAFDVAAVHVYTRKEKNVVETVKRVNREMRRAKDHGHPIWITEVSYPASKGKLKPVGALGRETPRGMGRRLYNTFLLLARGRKRVRLGRVYWYTWSSSYKREQRPSHFDYAGLVARSGPFDVKPQPALNYFRRIAERMEGCPKNERGRCRR